MVKYQYLGNAAPIYLKRVRILVVDASHQDRAVARRPDVRKHQAALDELGDVEQVGAGPRRGRKLHHAAPFLDSPGGVPGEKNSRRREVKLLQTTAAYTSYQDTHESSTQSNV